MEPGGETAASTLVEVAAKFYRHLQKMPAIF